MRSHEAGALHGQAGYRGPAWLQPPTDPNALVPTLWPSTVTKTDGVLHVAGVPVTQLAEEFGTATYVVDEEDFRQRARAFRDAFAGADVYYAAKAFLCLATARWVAEEGLNLDVCSGGELAVALRAGVEAHTHEYIATAHEDQKFGFSITGSEAFAAVRKILAKPRLELLGLHSHIGSQIFDTSGFEVAVHRVLALHGQIATELAYTPPEFDLGGGYGIAYTTQDDPSPPEVLAEQMTSIVARECAVLGIDVPKLSVEPGRAIAGPSTFTLYEVGTVKAVALDGGASRRYIAVDGGMSDNIRAALYDADFSCTLASRLSDVPPVLSRVVGKHCESGDIVVKDEFLPGDIAAGDLIAVPATGAYCRSLANTYNHIPRPAVVAVRDGVARVIMRRETEEDLFLLDVG